MIKMFLYNQNHTDSNHDDGDNFNDDLDDYDDGNEHIQFMNLYET